VRALEAEAVLLRRLQDLGVSIERRSSFNIGAGHAARQALDVFFAFTSGRRATSSLAAWSALRRCHP
jgi:hypothetical protein